MYAYKPSKIKWAFCNLVAFEFDWETSLNTSSENIVRKAKQFCRFSSLKRNYEVEIFRFGLVGGCRIKQSSVRSSLGLWHLALPLPFSPSPPPPHQTCLMKGLNYHICFFVSPRQTRGKALHFSSMILKAGLKTWYYIKSTVYEI